MIVQQLPLVHYTLQVGTARATGVRPLQVHAAGAPTTPLRPAGMALSGVSPQVPQAQEPPDGQS